MEEKRRNPRFPIHMELSITDLIKQDSCGIHNLNSEITITDISEGGIGFTSQCVLPENYYFEASFCFEKENKSFQTLVRIIRSYALTKELYAYGCILHHAPEELNIFIRSYFTSSE